LKKSTFAILCLEGAVLSFNVAAAAALIPSIAKDFVLSQFLIGRIVWIYMLTYGLAAFIYGPLVRKFDARRVELACIFLFSLANLMAGLSRSINTLFLGRFFMGLFGASVIPLGLILIAKHISKENRGKIHRNVFWLYLCSFTFRLILERNYSLAMGILNSCYIRIYSMVGYVFLSSQF
jgi:predicted MFS family arabinose efflux permease